MVINVLTKDSSRCGVSVSLVGLLNCCCVSSWITGQMLNSPFAWRRVDPEMVFQRCVRVTALTESFLMRFR